ncbi:MAG: RHS repeat protein [Candidatus Contendobacter sp.]|nr:RHS repeat protein [Candidatus Contendobacter sp.]
MNYTHTANGELKTQTVSGQTTSYAYDVLGNLRHVALPDGKTLDYLIDGRNRRIGKRVDGVLVQGFLYQDGLRPIAELDGNHQVVSRFVYAGGNAPDLMVKGGVTYRLIKDHLGSPHLVVDAVSGALAQRLGLGQGEPANPLLLGGGQRPQASPQQAQHQHHALFLAAFLTAFLAAFLAAFSGDFLIEAALLEFGVGESEHGFDLRAG